MSDLLLDIVRRWENGRDAISVEWRLGQSLILTPQVSSAMNRFTSLMDDCTRELMRAVSYRWGDAHIGLLSQYAPRRTTAPLNVYGVWATDVTSSPEWNDLDRESLYELVMNFDKILHLK